MNVFFTSDTHFNHPNVIKHDSRPFKDLEDMEESLIGRWNSKVDPQDAVYHLGDFALSWGKKSKNNIAEIFERLNGQKFLVKGNHDRKEVFDLGWRGIYDYREIKVSFSGEVHKQRICMMHYPIRSWNQAHRGAWMLHGHCHGNLPDTGGKILDVGTQCHYYSPVSLKEVKEFMDNREIKTEDHHQ